MKNHISITFRFIALCILALAFNSALAQDRAFIWEAKSSHNTVYLMGSIHFANPDFYPLRERIEQAFAESDNLVVEVDIANVDPVKTQNYLNKVGTYSGEETLLEHIDSKTLKLLKAHLQKRGLPLESFIKYKPGMLVMTLTSMEIMRMGLSPAQGIDVHFLNRARGNKNILELETLQQQLDLLLSLDDEGQMLRQTLEEFDTYHELMTTLINAWKTGDIEELNELLIEGPLRDYPESKPAFDKMFTQRNLQMTKKIKAYLLSNKTHFVVVGAGHLIGDSGIVTLLRKAGYQVRRI